MFYGEGNSMTERKIVLLIDAENTSAKYADGIMRYLEQQGVIISARIYGDFINNDSVKGWNSIAIEYEMEQKQQQTTNAGKNASDIALVIDAMDLLHQKRENIDTFCIVTSDGDFTGLVKRIREDGIRVIGIGKEDASKRLGKVCDEYHDFSELPGKVGVKKTSSKKDTVKKPAVKKPTAKKETVKKESIKKEVKNTSKKPAKAEVKQEVKHETQNVKTDSIPSVSDIKRELNRLIQQNEDTGKHAELGGIKSRLQLKYPGFNEKDYGYNAIRDFIDKETKFEVYTEGRHTYVIPRKKTAELARAKSQSISKENPETKSEEIHNQEDENVVLENACRYILKEYPKRIIGIHELGSLGRKLHNACPDFDYKEYGFKKLSAFLEEMEYTIY